MDKSPHRGTDGHEPIVRDPVTRSAFVEELDGSDGLDYGLGSRNDSNKTNDRSSAKLQDNADLPCSEVEFPRHSNIETSTLRSNADGPSPGAPNGASKLASRVSEPKSRPWYHPISLLKLALANWFLIGIGVAIALASQFPQVAAQGGCE